MWPDVRLDDPEALAAWLDKNPEVADAVARGNGEGDEGLEIPGSILEWRWRTPVDAFEPRPPLEYAVDGLFPLPSLSLVYGIPGCFKTMLLTELGICAAAGKPWLEPRPGGDQIPPIQTGGNSVLWLDFDNGQRVMDARVEAICNAHDLEPEGLRFFYVSLPTPPLYGDSTMRVQEFIEAANALEAEMVVIDNLSRVSGNARENYAEIGDVMANFRIVGERTGAAVVLVHHARKSTGFNSRAGERLRGHSAIEGSLDLALLVEREADTPNVTITATKVRGAEVPPMGAVFAYEQRSGSRELARARFFGVPVLDDSRPARAKRAVLEAIKESDEPLTKTRLIRAAQREDEDLGVNYLRDTIDILLQEGKIAMNPGPRNSQLFSSTESHGGG